MTIENDIRISLKESLRLLDNGYLTTVAVRIKELGSLLDIQGIGTPIKMDKETEESLEFAGRVAKTMDKLRSSHVFFILQSAYPENDDWEWANFQDLLSRIIVASGRRGKQ